MKRLTIQILFLSIMLMLAACTISIETEGQPLDDTVEEQTAETAEEMAESAIEEEKEAESNGCNITPPAIQTSINVIGWPFPITEFYMDELAECGEVDNVTVNTELVDAASVHQQARVALSVGGKSPYDIIHESPPQMIEFASAGWLRPLDDLVEKYREQYDLDDIPESAWAAASYDGQIYGVPFIGNTTHLMVRSDLFEQYGLEIPTTYDEVIAACEVLKTALDLDLNPEEDPEGAPVEDGSDAADDLLNPMVEVPFVMNLHAGWAWELEFLHFYRSFGGASYLNEDNSAAFNNKMAAAAVYKMMEVVDSCMGKTGLAYTLADSESGMRKGQVAFVNLWANYAPEMYNEETSNFVDEIIFAPAPAPNVEGSLGGSTWIDMYVIPATSGVDPELTFQIIMEAVDLESQMAAAELGVVTRDAVATSGAGGPYLNAVATTLANGAGSYAPNPAVTLAQTALGNWLPYVGVGELTPEEALRAAEMDYTMMAIAQGYLE
ncbi:MAG: extracellular solute-binding protein [Chloroflexota bacterium]